MDIETISERLSQIVKIECDKLIDQIASEYNLDCIFNATTTTTIIR